jgi:hypothetical protein
VRHNFSKFANNSKNLCAAIFGLKNKRKRYDCPSRKRNSSGCCCTNLHKARHCIGKGSIPGFCPKGSSEGGEREKEEEERKERVERKWREREREPQILSVVARTCTKRGVALEKAQYLDFVQKGLVEGGREREREREREGEEEEEVERKERKKSAERKWSERASVFVQKDAMHWKRLMPIFIPKGSSEEEREGGGRESEKERKGKKDRENGEGERNSECCCTNLHKARRCIGKGSIPRFCPKGSSEGGGEIRREK